LFSLAEVFGLYFFSNGISMIATPEGQLLLRLNDAARVLSISPTLLRRMTRAGDIPVVRMGSALRYDPEALRAYIKAENAKPYEPRQSLRRTV
jgi:excisionase family DNA binding protein